MCLLLITDLAHVCGFEAYISNDRCPFVVFTISLIVGRKIVAKWQPNTNETAPLRRHATLEEIYIIPLFALQLCHVLNSLFLKTWNQDWGEFFNVICGFFFSLQPLGREESLLPSEPCLLCPLKVWQLIRFYLRSCVKNCPQATESFHRYLYIFYSQQKRRDSAHPLYKLVKPWMVVSTPWHFMHGCIPPIICSSACVVHQFSCSDLPPSSLTLLPLTEKKNDVFLDITPFNIHGVQNAGLIDFYWFFWRPSLVMWLVI